MKKLLVLACIGFVMSIFARGSSSCHTSSCHASSHSFSSHSSPHFSSSSRGPGSRSSISLSKSSYHSAPHWSSHPIYASGHYSPIAHVQDHHIYHSTSFGSPRYYILLKNNHTHLVDTISNASKEDLITSLEYREDKWEWYDWLVLIFGVLVVGWLIFGLTRTW